MFSPKLKWPRETSCIPNSTLQPISDQNEMYFIYGIPSFITHDNDSMTLQYRPTIVLNKTVTALISVWALHQEKQ